MAPVRFGYGLGLERFERFRFSVLAVPLRRSFSCVSVEFNRELRFRFRFRFPKNGSGGSGSSFGSWKNGSGVPVSGSGSVPGPPWGLSQGQTRFVPGKNPVKTWDKPRFSPPHFAHWKPDFTGFVPGTNPVCPGTIPGTKGGTESLCEKSLCAFFAR